MLTRSQLAAAKQRGTGVPCATAGCSMFGTSAANWLCSRCSQRAGVGHFATVDPQQLAATELQRAREHIARISYLCFATAVDVAALAAFVRSLSPVFYVGDDAFVAGLRRTWRALRDNTKLPLFRVSQLTPVVRLARERVGARCREWSRLSHAFAALTFAPWELVNVRDEDAAWHKSSACYVGNFGEPPTTDAVRQHLLEQPLRFAGGREFP